MKVPIYDPCGPYSRLGTTLKNFRDAVGDGYGEDGAGGDGHRLAGISGLHFHNLCELGADSLERTLAVFEEKFGKSSTFYATS